MNEVTKETTPKDRIVVLDKGKDMQIGPLGFCCWSSLGPIRGW